MRHDMMAAAACDSSSPAKQRPPSPPLPSSPPTCVSMMVARTRHCAHPLRSTKGTRSLSPSAPSSCSRIPGRPWIRLPTGSCSPSSPASSLRSCTPLPSGCTSRRSTYATRMGFRSSGPGLATLYGRIHMPQRRLGVPSATIVEISGKC